MEGTKLATIGMSLPKSSKSAVARRLRPRLALRVAAICLTGCLTIYLAFASPYWMAAIWTGLACTALFYETVRYLDQSERKLTAFLQSLRQNDFSVTFSENIKSNDYDLHRAFNQLNDTYKNLRSEKESQHQLLQVIVDHAAVPLICFQEQDDAVFLINDAAKNLFQIPFLQKIDSLWRVERSLPQFLRDIHDGEKSSLKLMVKGSTIYLSVTSRHLVFKNSRLKLIALTDVSSELIAKEAEAWQKLLRVLTHEIANSAIPLSTLSSYIYEMVSHSEAENRMLSDDERKDVLDSLRTIDQRSTSLKEFVHRFKSVNQVPEPVLKKVIVGELIEEITRFFTQEFSRDDISLQIDNTHTAQTIYADKNLTMQVLINLIKNAIEAMSNFKSGKSIRIDVQKEGGRYVNMTITDSGCGIEPADLEQIFVPFYSTKQSGSGIGLSISQQIMQKQKGNIVVHSVPGKGSAFTLNFIC